MTDPTSPPQGVVPTEGREALPLAGLHGEPLLVHAVRALLAAGLEVTVTTDLEHAEAVARALETARLTVPVADAASWWSTATGDVLLHDPLCPLVPDPFVRSLLGPTHEGARAAYRPLTDTVKTVVDQQIVGTLDRDQLAVVTSPVLVPADLVAQWPPTEDFGALAGWLRERGPLELVKAPTKGRRVGDESAVLVLECLDEIDRRVPQA